MPLVDLAPLAGDQRAAGAWTAALLHALARDEAAGRRPRRLTEPNLATWTRFRGRLTATDFVALVFEDAAVLHRVPFDREAVDAPSNQGQLSPDTISAWLTALADADLTAASADYVLEQAKLLGLPTRIARSELHVVKSHHKLLELPGTGGQLAHHLVRAQRDVTLQDNFTIACTTWQELTLAGVVALDLVAPHTDFIPRIGDDDLRRPDHPLRQRSFDFVLGLHPDKGGLYQAQDQLAVWFPTAKILLV